MFILSPSRLFLGCLLIGLTAGLSIGCGDARPSPQVEAARRLLQRDKPQDAFDLLKTEQSAEGRYLKAVALNRLELRDAAREQIAAARKQQPKTLKYRGFDLGLRLQQGGPAEEAELIALYEEHPSSAAVAYFAFRAHESQAVRRQQESRGDEAEASGKAAVQALQSAITLSAETPELQRDMLGAAVKYNLNDGIQRLVDHLQDVAPDDPELTKIRVAAYLLADRPKHGLDVAQSFYRESNRSEQAAVIYATALSQTEAGPNSDREFEELMKRHRFNADVTSRYAVYLTRSSRFEQALAVLERGIDIQPDEEAREMLKTLADALPGRYASVLTTMPATAERDREFQLLMKQNPDHPGIVAGYAVYLTRSNRFQLAAALLDEAVEQTANPRTRHTLMRVSINLALEVGAADLAQRQLDGFRDKLRDRLLITYFEGRLLFLKKDHQAALQKMNEIVAAQKAGRGSSALAAEALMWMDRILADRALHLQIEKTGETVQGGEDN